MNHRLTKIIATIGSASERPESVEALIKAGVDIFRFNYKYHTKNVHKNRIQTVIQASQKLKKPVGLLLDLQGPELRLERHIEPLNARKGDIFPIVHAPSDNPVDVWFSFDQTSKHLKPGQTMYVDDGRLKFTVVTRDKALALKCVIGGVFKSHKTVTLPNLRLPMPSITPRDIEGLELARQMQMTHVALSFVRSARDIEVLRKHIADLKFTISVMAKIETRDGLTNIDEILTAADGVMVARGDLGVEIAPENVPFIQKNIITKAVTGGAYAITATQMLESLVEQTMPTRAEISDIANATYDHTDALMLSGETAVGVDPAKAVHIMHLVASANETKFEEDTRLRYDYDTNTQEEFVADAAYNLYWRMKYADVHAKGFVIFASSARSVRLITRYRMNIPIYAFCIDKYVANELLIDYGVQPILIELDKSKKKRPSTIGTEEVQQAIAHLKKHKNAKVRDTFIVVFETYWSNADGISTIKVITTT